jgi:hypothetical protein
MRKIIVLDISSGDPGETVVNYLMWIPVPVGQEIPTSLTRSQFRNASPSEITALSSGTVIEEFHTAKYSSGFTAAQAEADLVIRYNNRMTAFAGRLNPNQFYGVSWDGTIWA